MNPGEFSDAEVEAIVARALEQQGSAGGPGLTLTEVEDVGRQVGLDPAAVRRAAAEIGRERDDRATAASSHVRVPQAASDDAVLRVEYMRSARAKFIKSIFSYLAVNVFLVFVNFKTGGALWFPWVLAGWGLGLAFKARKVFFPTDDEIHAGPARSTRRERRKAAKDERRAAFADGREVLIDAVVQRIVAYGAPAVRVVEVGGVPAQARAVDRQLALDALEPDGEEAIAAASKRSR